MAVRCLGHIYVVTSLFSNYFKKTVHVRALESVKANPQIDLPVINSLLYGFGGCGVMGFMCIASQSLTPWFLFYLAGVA
jgi:hypothetical protein